MRKHGGSVWRIAPHGFSVAIWRASIATRLSPVRGRSGGPARQPRQSRRRTRRHPRRGEPAHPQGRGAAWPQAVRAHRTGPQADRRRRAADRSADPRPAGDRARRRRRRSATRGRIDDFGRAGAGVEMAGGAADPLSRRPPRHRAAHRRFDRAGRFRRFRCRRRRAGRRRAVARRARGTARRPGAVSGLEPGAHRADRRPRRSHAPADHPRPRLAGPLAAVARRSGRARPPARRRSGLFRRRPLSRSGDRRPGRRDGVADAGGGRAEVRRRARALRRQGRRRRILLAGRVRRARADRRRAPSVAGSKPSSPPTARSEARRQSFVHRRRASYRAVSST
jgi:hypothetical protein